MDYLVHSGKYKVANGQTKTMTGGKLRPQRNMKSQRENNSPEFNLKDIDDYISLSDREFKVAIKKTMGGI